MSVRERALRRSSIRLGNRVRLRTPVWKARRVTAPAPELTEYARRRLAGRAMGATSTAVLVVCLAAARMAGPHSVAEDVVGLVLGLAVVVNVVAWIRPVHPGRLTRVDWPTEGSWRAAMRLTELGQVVGSRPRARGDALVMGQITFDAHGATFAGGKGATRTYGRLERRWACADLYAHRLRGWGGQGHLMLMPTKDRAAPVDVWIWGSKTFPLDASRD